MYACTKMCGHTLRSLLNVACKDAVDSNVYTNGAVLALVVVNDSVYKSSARCDERVEGLCAVYSRYTDFNDDIRHAGARLWFVHFLGTRVALTIIVRVTGRYRLQLTHC